MSADDATNMIVREVHERVLITGGRDYCAPTARVIQSTYAEAGDTEKAIYINQDKKSGVSLSLATLKAIVDWAEGRK